MSMHLMELLYVDRSALAKFFSGKPRGRSGCPADAEDPGRAGEGAGDPAPHGGVPAGGRALHQIDEGAETYPARRDPAVGATGRGRIRLPLSTEAAKRTKRTSTT